jgi:hypothetical protein
MIRSLMVLPTLVALYMPFCGAHEVRPTRLAPALPAPSLWERPSDLAERDLYYGPWGEDHAPNPWVTYTLIEHKHTGVNPGMTVVDPQGREWSVKQPADGGPDEGPVEVVLSRVLSAVGYHQPPVYYLPSFRLRDDWGEHLETGGRFRLKLKVLKDRGTWSFQQNPFVGTDPYQGLLVILMMFNASDLKNSNNTLYEFRGGDAAKYWYVVRDLGTALGGTGRFAPDKNSVWAFERHPYILGVRNGLVEFNYRGWHQELIRDRITLDDVAWASELLGALSERQWRAAFLAGGYRPAVTDRFIRVLQAKIESGRSMAAAGEREE